MSNSSLGKHWCWHNRDVDRLYTVQFYYYYLYRIFSCHRSCLCRSTVWGALCEGNILLVIVGVLVNKKTNYVPCLLLYHICAMNVKRFRHNFLSSAYHSFFAYNIFFILFCQWAWFERMKHQSDNCNWAFRLLLLLLLKVHFIAQIANMQRMDNKCEQSIESGWIWRQRVYCVCARSFSPTTAPDNFSKLKTVTSY